jgi:NADPH:quinone reductase-like Zn-dependent oxidoreductase
LIVLGIISYIIERNKVKAAQYSQYGDPDVIDIKEVEEPKPKADQVLVEIRSAAVNPFDWKLRRGYMKDVIPLQFPVTIGADFSGIVIKAGSDAKEYASGDEVYGSAIILGGGSGAVAEYAAANATSIAKKPISISHDDAASLVLVGVSAIQVIDEHMEIKHGQKILIHGGAGGIGSVAIQYAKHLGAYVATTARSADNEFVKALGADEIIDYENEDFTEKITDYDAVLDAVGGEVYRNSYKVLSANGIIVSMVEQPDEELISKYGVKGVYQLSKTDSKTLDKLSSLVDKSIIKAKVDKTFPLNSAAAAFAYAEEQKPKGKVVIAVKE